MNRTWFAVCFWVSFFICGLGLGVIFIGTPNPPAHTPSPELATAESVAPIVLRKPTATSQVFQTPFDGEKDPYWISSAPNVISVDKGVLWPLNPGVAAICIHTECYRVESKPNWMQDAPRQHDHLTERLSATP